MKRVVVHIERLTLRGIDPGNREAILEGLRQQLGQLLKDPGTSQGLLASGNVSYKRPDTIHLSREASASQLGRKLAVAICCGERNNKP